MWQTAARSGKDDQLLPLSAQVTPGPRQLSLEVIVPALADVLCWQTLSIGCQLLALLPGYLCCQLQHLLQVLACLPLHTALLCVCSHDCITVPLVLSPCLLAASFERTAGTLQPMQRQPVPRVQLQCNIVVLQTIVEQVRCTIAFHSALASEVAATR